MAGLDHRPADEQEPHDPHTAGRNARYGLILFAVYCGIYSAFVLLNAFRPDVMGQQLWAGINLAVLSGLGLILGAFLLSLIYGWLCRAPALPSDFPPRGDA